MNESEFKPTWQKVRVAPGSNLGNGWDKFRGKVKIDPDNDQRLIFDKKFNNHESMDIDCPIAQSLILDKTKKLKKLVVTVTSNDEVGEGPEVLLHESRKNAEAFLSSKTGTKLVFDWKAPVEVLLAWVDGSETVELHELGMDIEAQYSEILEEEIKKNFMEKVAPNLQVVLREAEMPSGYHFYLLQLIENGSNLDIDEFADFVEETGTEAKLFDGYQIWKPDNKDVLYEIFMTEYMNIADSDDLEKILTEETLEYLENEIKDLLTNKIAKEIAMEEYMKKNDVDMAPGLIQGTSRKDRVFDQGKAIGSAVVEGAAMAAADQGGELLLDLARRIAPKMPIFETLLETPEGRELSKFIVATIVHTTAYQTELMGEGKARELIIKAVEQQMKLSSYKIIGPQLAVLREFGMELIENGKELQEIEQLAKSADVFNKSLETESGDKVEIIEELPISEDEYQNG